MFRSLTSLAISLLLPLSAAAASYSTVGSMGCTGTTNVALLDTASFSCSGNFFLSGGSISSQSKIVIAADGSLSLDRLSLTAPFVELSSLNGQVSIGNGVLINTSSFLAAVGNVVTPTSINSPGASISVGSGETGRIIGPVEVLQAITHGAITPLVGGDISIASSVPEPSTYVSMLLGLLVVFGLTKRFKGSQYP